LVTGGTGFAGSHIVRRLAEKGHHVFALVRNKERLIKVLGKGFLQEKNITPLLMKNPTELTSTDFRKIIEQNNITTVVHNAAIVGDHWRIPWTEYYQVNVAWTESLARGFINADVDHNKFLFTSTVGVYGTIPEKLPADEKTGYKPDGKYHKSKVLAEKKLIKLRNQRNLPLLIFRLSTIYGDGDHGFLYKIFKLVRKRIFPLINSNFRIHLLDVKTLANVYSNALYEKTLDYFIFNIADDEPVDMQTLIRHIKKTTDGGYIIVPVNIFRILTKLFGTHNAYSIKLKLISQNRYYALQRLRSFKCNLGQTIANLEKYHKWYGEKNRDEIL
jgi:nucleoside-diphosphate-sugar epimerase